MLMGSNSASCNRNYCDCCVRKETRDSETSQLIKSDQRVGRMRNLLNLNDSHSLPHFHQMSFAATKLRPRQAQAFVRHRSTAASPVSHLEAKSRVREHARNISRSTTANATVAPAVYVVLTLMNVHRNTRTGDPTLPIPSLQSLCPPHLQAPLFPNMDP